MTRASVTAIRSVYRSTPLLERVEGRPIAVVIRPRRPVREPQAQRCSTARRDNGTGASLRRTARPLDTTQPQQAHDDAEDTDRQPDGHQDRVTHHHATPPAAITCRVILIAPDPLGARSPSRAVAHPTPAIVAHRARGRVRSGETSRLPPVAPLHCPGDRPRRPDEAVGRRVGGRVREAMRGDGSEGDDAPRRRSRTKRVLIVALVLLLVPIAAVTGYGIYLGHLVTIERPDGEPPPGADAGGARRQAGSAGPDRAGRDPGHRERPELPVHRLRRGSGPLRGPRRRHHPGPHPGGPAQRHADPLPA